MRFDVSFARNTIRKTQADLLAEVNKWNASEVTENTVSEWENTLIAINGIADHAAKEADIHSRQVVNISNEIKRIEKSVSMLSSTDPMAANRAAVQIELLKEDLEEAELVSADATQWKIESESVLAKAHTLIESAKSPSA